MLFVSSRKFALEIRQASLAYTRPSRDTDATRHMDRYFSFLVVQEPVAPEPGHHDDSNIAFYATSAAGAGLVYGHSAGLVNGYPAGLARGYPSRKKRDTFDTAEAGHASAPTASSFGSTTAMGNSGTGVPPGKANAFICVVALVFSRALCLPCDELIAVQHKRTWTG